MAAGLVQNPSTDRYDQLAVSDQRSELVRLDQPILRMMPAEQRLDGDQAPAREVELRLVVDLELAPIQGVTEVLGKGLAPISVGIHCPFEESNRVRSIPPGTAEREVGMAPQRLWLDRFRTGQRDADTETNLHALTMQIERIRHGRKQSLAQAFRITRPVHIGLNDREPVGANPRDSVGFAHTTKQTCTAMAEQQVTGGMTEFLVDAFETGEVNRQDRHHSIATPHATDGRMQALEKRGATRQTGERIPRHQRTVMFAPAMRHGQTPLSAQRGHPGTASCPRRNHHGGDDEQHRRLRRELIDELSAEAEQEAEHGDHALQTELNPKGRHLPARAPLAIAPSRSTGARSFCQGD